MKKKLFKSSMVFMFLFVSFMVLTKEADADALMFPWVVRSTDVTTVISVVNTAETDAESLDLPDHNNRIHIEYWHKLTAGNDIEEKCSAHSLEVTSSKDDMVTWDISGHFNSGLPMFNDTNNEVIGLPDMTLAVSDPRRAFLLVDNNTEALVDSGTNVDGTMYGEAIVIEHRTGAAWGYIAYNAWEGQMDPLAGEVWLDFADYYDTLGEVIGDIETTQAILLNPNNATTKLFVTPVGDIEKGEDRDQRRGNWNAVIQLCRFPEKDDNYTGSSSGVLPYTGYCTAGGIWNNEEGGFSFTTMKNIVCTSANNIVDFFGDAGTSAYAQWVASGKAGWSYIVTQPGNIDDRDGTDQFEEADAAILGKLEFGNGLNWNGGIADTINTFVWLRNIGSWCEQGSDNELCAGTNVIHNEYAGQLQ